MYYKKHIVMLIGLIILLNSAHSSCNSTAVQLFDGEAPLANAGNYFLSQNVTGAVSISGSNITLNLNGYQIEGLTIGSGLSNIRVSNGIIDGTVSIGVLNAANTSNVHLTDLEAKNSASSGIDIIQASEIFISRVLVRDTTGGPGINISGASKRVFITDSELCNNSASGAGTGFGINVLSQASEVIVRNTQSYSNGSSGASVNSQAKQIYFIRFISAKNAEDGIVGSTNSEDDFTSFACIDCIFEGNTDNGINPKRTTFIFKGCVAENNTQNGFLSANTQVGIMTQCVAINNSDDGFNDLQAGSTTCRYTSNYADNNNSTNYSQSGSPYNTEGSTDSAAQFWRNIDGSLF